MNIQYRRTSQLISLALIITVVTQVVYLALEAGGKSHVAYPIWRIEALAMLATTALGFALVPRNALIGGCIAAGAIFNVIQIGMGLTMFYQLGYGGEEPPLPVFPAVLQLSFFLYFAAKALIGIAAMALGIALWRSAPKLPRIIGAVTIIAGLASLLTNAAAMTAGMSIVFIAGGAGTVATLFVALALLMPGSLGKPAA